MKKVKGFSEAEKTAMKDRVEELKRDKKDGEKAVLEKIEQMPEPDRSLAKKLHALIKKTAPTLTSRTWYGMPAYANKEDKVICFFQNASKFKVRYATLGFSDVANLDEDDMWPTSFALKKLTSTEEEKITALINKAIN